MKSNFILAAITLCSWVAALPRTHPRTTGFLPIEQTETGNALEKTLIGQSNVPKQHQVRSAQNIAPSRNHRQNPRKNTARTSHRLFKSKQASLLLSSMQKLRRIKHHRNRRVRLNVLATAHQRNLHNRSRYLQIKPGKRTRKQLPDLALSLVHGNDNMNDQRSKGYKQKFYKRVLCGESSSHKFCG